MVDTFGDTIDREMLSEELAAELDAKAEQTALTGVDSRLQSAEATLQAHTAQLAQKAGCISAPTPVTAPPAV